MDPSPSTTIIPWIPVALIGVGFLAAVGLGSLAWFNSKRPAGWEDAERPSYMPKVGDDAPNAESSSESKR